MSTSHYVLRGRHEVSLNVYILSICVSLTLFIANATADSTFDSIKSDAFLEELTRIAQPPCEFPSATESFFAVFGRDSNTETALLSVLRDESSDFYARRLTVWALTELGTDAAQTELTKFIEAPLPSSLPEGTTLEQRLDVLRTGIMYLGRIKNSSLLRQLENWSSGAYWDSRADFQVAGTQIMTMEASQRERIIAGLREAALLSITWQASSEAVALVERLVGTTCNDMHPTVLGNIVNEARSKAGITNTAEPTSNTTAELP
ncbi:MAG: hypothetical protein K8Q91_03770 [Candidatus Vogelbacteria bacterium]|nr:hypothetical protein [Candidatus Vogelbacteria bacterium]